MGFPSFAEFLNKVYVRRWNVERPSVVKLDSQLLQGLKVLNPGICVPKNNSILNSNMKILSIPFCYLLVAVRVIGQPESSQGNLIDEM